MTWSAVQGRLEAFIELKQTTSRLSLIEADESDWPRHKLSWRTAQGRQHNPNDC